MNFNKLRYVVAVDREGSILGAAKILHITQSAVTKAVADVESELGVSIFDRHSRGIVTTAAGREFVARAARILADMNQLEVDTKTGRDSRERVLRIGIAPPSLEGLMNRAVRHLVLNHKDVRVQLRGTPFEAGMQLLRQGDLDTLIGPSGPVTGAGLVGEPIAPLKAHMFARKGHPLSRRPLCAAELAGYPIITPDLSGPTVVPILGILDHLDGDPIRGLHMLENFPMASGIIERSDAVGTVVDAYIQSQAFKSRFEVLDFDMGDPVPMALVYRTELQPSRAMGWLRAALTMYPPTDTAPSNASSRSERQV